jgi:hypothetical protein
VSSFMFGNMMFDPEGKLDEVINSRTSPVMVNPGTSA